MGKLLITVSVLALSIVTSGGVAQAQAEIDLWGHRMIGLSEAHERGYTGAGVLVGVMDQAAQPDHPEYADRWQGGMNVDYSPFGPYDLSKFHGTHVAGTVAGTHVGVAPEALLYSINWEVDTITDASFAEGYRWGMQQGVRIFNNSWEDRLYVDTPYVRTMTVFDVGPDEFASLYPTLLPTFFEGGDLGVIQVFATGNSTLEQPSVLAGLPYYYPDLLPGWIAVTAVGPSGTIASYANLCGVAAEWCVAAPGGDGEFGSQEDIWSAWPGSAYYSIHGTSMATPHVTGAVAIAAQMFPDASSAELVQIVLQTATDIGDPGIDPVYGWGLLNVGNMVEAIEPVTAGTFANAAWSRSTTLGHVTAILRQRMGLSGADRRDTNAGVGLLGYASADRTLMRGGVSFSGAPVPHIWVSPVFGSASIAASASSFAATSTMGGVVVGADLVHYRHAQVGLALGYTNTRLFTDGAADRADMNAFHLGAYGAWRNNGWFVQGTGQAAFFSQSIERHAIAGANGLSFDPVGRSALSGTGADLSVQAGYDIHIAGGATLSPYVGFGALWHGHSAAAESDAGIFGLALPATAYSQFEAGPGLRIRSAPIAVGTASLQMAADVAYARVIGNTGNPTTVSLLGRDIAGRSAEAGRDVLRVGAELNLTAGERFDWFAAYRGAFRKDAAAHTVGAGLKVSF